MQSVLADRRTAPFDVIMTKYNCGSAMLNHAALMFSGVRSFIPHSLLPVVFYLSTLLILPAFSPCVCVSLLPLPAFSVRRLCVCSVCRSLVQIEAVRKLTEGITLLKEGGGAFALSVAEHFFSV